MTVRRTLLESFIAELQPVGLLDRFQLAGVIVRWWNTNQYDLRTLVAHGFTGVVDGWVTTITTAMEDSDAKTDPLDHKLVPELLPSYLEELAAVEARRAELDAQIKAAAATGDEDDEEPADDRGAVTGRTRRPEEAVDRGQEAAEGHAAGVHHQARQGPRRTHRGPGTRPRPPPGQERRRQPTWTATSPPTASRSSPPWKTGGTSTPFPLHQIEAERDAATTKLAGFLKDLGYE